MRAHVTTAFAFVAALGACSTGCATATADDLLGDADTAQTHAFLRVDRTEEVGDPSTAKARGSARFLRLHGEVDPSIVARVIGAAPNLPAPGECAAVDGADPTLALHALSTMELSQAGDVTLSSGNVATPLVARAYPDVAHLVSGVVYTTPDVEDVSLAREAKVIFHVGGSTDVPAFDAELDVPSPVSGVLVGGAALGTIAPARVGGPLVVSWDPAAGDETYADIAWTSDAKTSRLRCVPSAGASAVSLGADVVPLASTFLVAVHRVRAARFEAPGLSTGEVRFDTAVAGRVAFAPPG